MPEPEPEPEPKPAMDVFGSVGERSTELLHALRVVEERSGAKLAAATEVHLATPAVKAQIAAWAGQSYSAEREAACEQLRDELAACASVGEARACPAFAAFEETVGGIPAKLLKAGQDADAAQLLAFAEGQVKRYSRATAAQRAEGRARKAAEREVAASSSAEAAEAAAEAAALAAAHAEWLALSDHRAIAVRVSGLPGGASLRVSSHNVMERVADGVQTYAGSMPCVKGSRGKGYSTLLSDAMLSAPAVARHEQRVLGWVDAQLGAADAVCLQEVDRSLLRALCSDGRWHVHACATADEPPPAGSSGRCCAITAICTLDPPRCLLPDVVVTTSKKVRRHAAAVLDCGVTLVSVHVRHTERQSGGRGQPSNAENIAQTVDAIAAAFADALRSGEAVLACGDFNGPAAGSITEAGSVAARGAVAPTPTQFDKELAVDGAVVLTHGMAGSQVDVFVCDCEQQASSAAGAAIELAPPAIEGSPLLLLSDELCISVLTASEASGAPVLGATDLASVETSCSHFHCSRQADVGGAASLPERAAQLLLLGRADAWRIHVGGNESHKLALYLLQIGALPSVLAGTISAGLSHTVLTELGAEVIYSCGAGGAGQLGFMSAQADDAAVPSPVTPEAPNNLVGLRELEGLRAHHPRAAVHMNGRIACLSAGGIHTLAAGSCGVVSWGDAGAGALGHGFAPSHSSQPAPRIVGSLRQSVTLVAAGLRHSACVTAEGQLWTFGEGFGGKLGHGSEANCFEPTRVERLDERAVRVACGGHSTAVVTAGRRLLLWGMVSPTSMEGVRVPTEVELLSEGEPVPMRDVSCGVVHYAAVSWDGRLFTWGRNQHGQLGRQTEAAGSAWRKDEVEALADQHIVSVACGHNHTAAVDDSGTLYTFGRREMLQYGGERNVISQPPSPVLGPVRYNHILLFFNCR